MESEDEAITPPSRETEPESQLIPGTSADLLPTSDESMAAEAVPDEAACHTHRFHAPIRGRRRAENYVPIYMDDTGFSYERIFEWGLENAELITAIEIDETFIILPHQVGMGMVQRTHTHLTSIPAPEFRILLHPGDHALPSHTEAHASEDSHLARTRLPARGTGGAARAQSQHPFHHEQTYQTGSP